MPGKYKMTAGKPRVKRSAKKVPTISAGMKQAIKKVVASQDETKYVAESWDEQTIGASVNSTSGTNLYQMIPSVVEGVGASERIGNSLVPKGIKTHFFMHFPNDSLPTANVYVRLLCLSSRQVKAYDDQVALTGQNLFYTGDGSAQDIPLAGASASFGANARENQFLAVNKKSWIVHHDKVFHFAKNYGFTSNDTTAGRDPTTTVPVCHTVCLSTPHKGALKYDSPGDVTPNNFAPFWCAYMWTGDAGDTVASIKISTRSEMYFTG